MQRAARHRGPSATPARQIKNYMEMNAFEGDSVQPGICLHRQRASEPRSPPLLRSPTPTRDVCRDVCKTSFAHTALCHRNPPVHSLAHLHSCDTPSHTLGSLLSHTCRLSHVTASSHSPTHPHLHSHTVSMFLVTFVPYRVWASLCSPPKHSST